MLLFDKLSRAHCIEVFCASDTWVLDSDAAIIAVLTSNFNVFHHIPRRDKRKTVVLVVSLGIEYSTKNI